MADLTVYEAVRLLAEIDFKDAPIPQWIARKLSQVPVERWLNSHCRVAEWAINLYDESYDDHTITPVLNEPDNGREIVLVNDAWFILKFAPVDNLVKTIKTIPNA